MPTVWGMAVSTSGPGSALSVPTVSTVASAMVLGTYFVDGDKSNPFELSRGAPTCISDLGMAGGDMGRAPWSMTSPAIPGGTPPASISTGPSSSGTDSKSDDSWKG